MHEGISIIIPACNANGHISRAVGSVLSQGYGVFEIVIASDDEQDYLPVLAGQGIDDERIRQVYTGGIRTGLPHARNCGTRAANHRIIVSLDADDALQDGYLEAVAPLAEAHGAVLSQVMFVDDENGAPIPNKGRVFSSGLLPLEDIYSACVHSYASIAFDRKRLLHPWREEIPLLEDAVFVAECCAQLGRVWYQAEPLYRYSFRKGSLCNSAAAPERFLKAGQVIRALVDKGEICAGNDRLQSIVKAYLDRNDRIEHALLEALKTGAAKDYQDFIGKNPAMLHTPLV